MRINLFYCFQILDDLHSPNSLNRENEARLLVNHHRAAEPPYESIDHPPEL